MTFLVIAGIAGATLLILYFLFRRILPLQNELGEMKRREVESPQE
jgi:hypothetical protein